MGEGLGALCVSYIYKRSSHWRGSILINPSLHKGTTYGWESGFHHMKFLGDAKAETIADTNVNWLFLLRWLSSPTLHWSSFPASPCSHSIHSITLGFTSPGQSSVSSISYSAYSMFPSPLLRPREPTRKCRCVHFCKVPSLSLSGSSFLGPCWNRVNGNKMGKFWHHWLTWCCWSLFLV